MSDTNPFYQKATFLAVYAATRGNTKLACDAADISRRTFYHWEREDEAFADSLEDIDEGIVDFVESKLFDNIEEGSSRDIQFYLKTKAKHRGYSETVHHDHHGEIAHLHGPNPAFLIGEVPTPKTLEEWEHWVTKARAARIEAEKPEPTDAQIQVAHALPTPKAEEALEVEDAEWEEDEPELEIIGTDLPCPDGGYHLLNTTEGICIKCELPVQLGGEDDSLG